MIAKVSQRKAWTRIVLCLPFAGIGLFLALAGDGNARIAGGLFGGLFLLLMLLQLRLALGKATIIIDEHGIFDQRVTDRPVPWSEVRGVTEVVSGGLRYFYLDVGPDEGRFTDQSGKTLHKWLNGGPVRGVPVNPNGLDVGIDVIRAAIERGLASR